MRRPALALVSVALSAVLATLLGVALAAAVGLARPTPAAACSCVGISVRRALEQADAVFQGTLTRVEADRIGGQPTAVLRFDVTRVFKGTVYADQVVTTPPDSAGCGLTPDVGSTWVVFATSAVVGEGKAARLRLTTTLCSGNMQTKNPPAELGRAGAPLPGASDRAERSASADARLTQGMVVVGLGALGLAALAGIGLAYLWRPGRGL